MTGRAKGLMLVGLIAIPAMAFTFGGWAVNTVEDVPEHAVAGKTFDLTYSVRQHGMGLMSGLSGTVNLWSGEKKLQAPAVSIGEGMYRARITIPQAGDWTYQVVSGFSTFGDVAVPLKVVAATDPAPAALSPYDRGQQLYLAKGCATCHTHQLAKSTFSTRLGTDLSEPKFTSAYLSRFLANPSIKTDWKSSNRMPNLGLKPAEITALTAFLNQEKRTASR